LSTTGNNVIFVFGVSGSGKSTIGKQLAGKLQIPFFDGDDFHPPANRTKMASGIPLTDDDRLGWLEKLNEVAVKELSNHSIVIACSALKESYRQVLMRGIEQNCFWFLLRGNYEVIVERMKSRSHFMPASLLQSQFDLLEVPRYATLLDIALSPEEILDLMLIQVPKMKSELGIIGLGVMGSSLARNFAGKGFRLSLFNQRVEKQEEDVAVKLIKKHRELDKAVGFEDLAQFIDSLQSPRIALCMIPAGTAIDQLIKKLEPLLAENDILIDAGNSHFKDTERRQVQLALKGIHYVGMGVSGGEEGALKGPSMMLGTTGPVYDRIKKYMEPIAAISPRGEKCCARVGEGGAGHFVKMVHNGIEYAEMQLLAELYGILRWGKGYSPDEMANIFETWTASDVNNYLLSISVDILRKKEGSSWLIDSILDTAENKGTGSWTTIAAAELGVPIPTITEALFARYTSSFKQLRVQFDEKINLPVLPIKVSTEKLMKAYRLARISNHQQGFHLIEVASNEFEWKVDLSTLAKIWTNGCIIRSTLMERLETSLANVPQVMMDFFIQSTIALDAQESYDTLGEILKVNVPVPALSSALTYIQSMSKSTSYGNFIQAQRDYFGAHGYQRVDDPQMKKVHTEWKN